MQLSVSACYVQNVSLQSYYGEKKNYKVQSMGSPICHVTKLRKNHDVYMGDI